MASRSWGDPQERRREIRGGIVAKVGREICKLMTIVGSGRSLSATGIAEVGAELWLWLVLCVYGWAVIIANGVFSISDYCSTGQDVRLEAVKNRKGNLGRDSQGFNVWLEAAGSGAQQSSYRQQKAPAWERAG